MTRVAGTVGPSGLVVRPASVEEILPIRKAVLRPGEPVQPSDYDARPGVVHVAAFDGDVVVGCATVFPSPYDGEPAAWQLRGMAVAHDRQCSGIGGAVLRAAIGIVGAAGAPLLWANARIAALRFYQRHGFQVVGEEFSYGPAALPHRVIELRM